MNPPTGIASLRGRQIFDSRGRPTVEVEVTLRDGSTGRASAPSGASTGRHEAHELRDGDPGVHAGRGVLRAVAHVNNEIARSLVGRNASDQSAIDARMRELDGSDTLNRLGANAILATSLAVCRASAVAHGLPLHRYLAILSGTGTPSMPMPMVNILSGGAHAAGGMDLQDFLVVPIGAEDFDQALRTVFKVRLAADRIMSERGFTTLLADEGGLSPPCRHATEALDLLVDAIRMAGLRPGHDAAIAIDVAASTLHAAGAYELRRAGVRLTADEMIATVAGWRRDYPVVSVEDALHEDDWAGWTRLTSRIGDIQLIGDDLFATNVARIDAGIRQHAANAVLIKINQNGTLSGTLDAIAHARRGGYATIVSARSGETEDSFIADLAVGTAAGQIKIGSVRTSERMAKYNQLVRIGEDNAIPFAAQQKAALHR
jgi:enolase